AGLTQITGDYFATIGARVIAGRAITDDDVAQHAAVAVVSVRGARLLWPDASPDTVLGRPVEVPDEPIRVVVGVVADQRSAATRARAGVLFVPFGQADPKIANRDVTLVARLRAGATLDVRTLRDALRADYPNASLTAAEAPTKLDPFVEQPKLQTWLFTAFAA